MSRNVLHIDPIAIALQKKAEREAQRNNSPSTSGSQATLDRQPITDSQLSGPPAPGPVVSQPDQGSQANVSSQTKSDTQNEPPLSLLDSLPDIKGDLRLPHRYTDALCRWLSADEQAVYFQLYRLSWGWNKDTCLISNPRLSERSNVPLTSMKRAVTKLIAKGLVKKTGQQNGFGKEQGVEYWVANLDWQANTGSQTKVGRQANTAYNKERFKEINKKGAAPPDFKNCPDCHGTGMYYPEGVSNGVKKCRHEQLKASNA